MHIFFLTVRNSNEEWYNSHIRFHRKLFYKNKPIDSKLVKNINYIKKEYIYDFLYNIYKTNGDDLYNKKKLIDYYKNHNNNCVSFFKNNNRFLKINLSKKMTLLK